MTPLRCLSPLAFLTSLVVSHAAFAQEPAQGPAAQDPATPAPAAPTPALQTSASAEAHTSPLAPPPPPPPESDSYPRIGGHVGTAIPILTLSKDSTIIGADFVKLGVTPGISVHLDDKWTIDFEFIAFNELKASNGPANTTFVVDPGLLRKFGPVTAGLRVATEVGAPSNIGLVPIIVVPVAKVTKRVSYFVEADVPLFLRDTIVGANVGGFERELRPSATLLLQTGFGF